MAQVGEIALNLAAGTTMKGVLQSFLPACLGLFTEKEDRQPRKRFSWSDLAFTGRERGVDMWLRTDGLSSRS